MCMPNVNPPIENPAAFEAARAAGAGRAHVDFAIQGSITPANIERLPELWQCGITSFEIGLSDGAEGIRVARLDDPAVLARALEMVALDRRGGRHIHRLPTAHHGADRAAARRRADDFAAHAEARPPLTEAIGLAMMLEMARATGARVVCRQVCTRRGFRDRSPRAKPSCRPAGSAVEVTPHNLCLTVDALDRVGRFGQIVPPLRSEDDRRATVEALADGTVDFVGSDHAPHAVEEKNRAFGLGIPQRQSRAGYHRGGGARSRGARHDFLYLRGASAVPNGRPRCLGWATARARLVAGADGDLVLVDPDAERTVTPADDPFQDEALGVRRRAAPGLAGAYRAAGARGRRGRQAGRAAGGTVCLRAALLPPD